jgi:hypothetical protein
MRNAARRRPVERAEQMQQRALSRAARADDRDHLAPGDLQIDGVEHDDLAAVATDVRLRQRLGLQHAHLAPSPPPAASVTPAARDRRWRRPAIIRLAMTVTAMSSG